MRILYANISAQNCSRESGQKLAFSSQSEKSEYPIGFVMCSPKIKWRAKMCGLIGNFIFQIYIFFGMMSSKPLLQASKSGIVTMLTTLSDKPRPHISQFDMYGQQYFLIK